MPIKSLGLPPLCAQVPALFVASMSSYVPESFLTLGHYIEYAHGTIDISKSSLYPQCYNAYCNVFAPLLSFKLSYFLGKESTLLLLFVPCL